MKNPFLWAFGERDNSNGMTAGLVQVIQWVAQHIEVLIRSGGLVALSPARPEDEKELARKTERHVIKARHGEADA